MRLVGLFPHHICPGDLSLASSPQSSDAWPRSTTLGSSETFWVPNPSAGSPGQRTQGNPDTRIHAYRDTQTDGHKDTQTHGILLPIRRRKNWREEKLEEGRGRSPSPSRHPCLPAVSLSVPIPSRCPGSDVAVGLRDLGCPSSCFSPEWAIASLTH